MLDKELNPLQLPVLQEIWQSSLNWTASQKTIAQFERLYQMVIEKNQQMNLTKITQPVEFWEKHLWDSLSGVLNQNLTHFMDQKIKAIDIGTGAGFPGVPLSIVLPNWQITLLDSTRKKVNFLAQVKEQLNLPNIQPLNARAETIAKDRQHRDNYDLALIRAVSQASVCAEYTLPLLKKDGIAVLYRGLWSNQDTEKLSSMLPALGGSLESVHSFITPISQSIRHCIYIRKTSTTSNWQYPRPVGISAQRPL